MKILYFDFNLTFMNPTRKNIHLLLSQKNELTCFGPGFVPDADLTPQGFEKLLKEKGPFDYLAINEHSLTNLFWFGYLEMDESEVNADLERRYKNYAMNFSDFKAYVRMLRYLKDYCLAGNEKLLVFLLESDFYHFNQMRVDSIEMLVNDHKAHVISWGEEFFLPVSDLPNLEKEDFKGLASDNWLELAHRIKSSMISLTHFVEPTEFCDTPLKNRTHLTMVPGALYWARRVAIQSLEDNNVKTPWMIQNKIWSLLHRLGLKPFSYKWFIKFYQKAFFQQLFNSKTVFTCGSGLGWSIRKFFEIGAAGSVLICVPPVSFHVLGFKDKELGLFWKYFLMSQRKQPCLFP